MKLGADVSVGRPDKLCLSEVLLQRVQHVQFAQIRVHIVDDRQLWALFDPLIQRHLVQFGNIKQFQLNRFFGCRKIEKKFHKKDCELATVHFVLSFYFGCEKKTQKN